MSKQSNQKLKLLYLLRILLEQTDENSGLTLSEISKELAKYNISAARKSLYDDIEELRLFGIDVRVKRDRYVKYYIGKREFSFVELRYIIDALEQFCAIDPSVARAVGTKLMAFLGVKGRGYIEDDVSATAKMPTVITAEQDKNINIINNAISHNQKIRCREFSWNPQKQRILKNDGKVLTLTPIRLACDKKYLMYAFDGTSVQQYFVSRLLDVDILDIPGDAKSEYERFLSDDAENEYANVRIEFDNSFASEVFEKFGLGVTVLSVRDEKFEFSIKIKLDEDFYVWLFNNAKHIRKISPERVREEYREYVLLALQSAENDKTK